MQENWEVDEDVGNSPKYWVKTKAGQRYMPKLDFVGPDGKLKTFGKY